MDKEEFNNRYMLAPQNDTERTGIAHEGCVFYDGERCNAPLAASICIDDLIYIERTPTPYAEIAEFVDLTLEEKRLIDELTNVQTKIASIKNKIVSNPALWDTVKNDGVDYNEYKVCTTNAQLTVVSRGDKCKQQSTNSA